MPGKNTRMKQWVGYRVRVTVDDHRMLVGTFLAFDRHLNFVLADCEEFRKVKTATKDGAQQEVKRTLGLILLRGDTIVSMTAEAPPPAQPHTTKADSAMHMVGKGVPAGRGVPVAPMGAAPPGLGSAPRGVGMAAPHHMLPMPGIAPAGMRPPPGMAPPGMGRSLI